MEQLHRAGITEDMLHEIIANGTITAPISNDHDAPTYGILIELYHFSHAVANYSYLSYFPIVQSLGLIDWKGVLKS